MFIINLYVYGYVNEIFFCGCIIFLFILRMFINNYFFIMFNFIFRVNDQKIIVVVVLLSYGCICYFIWGVVFKVRIRYVVKVVIKMYS